MAEGGDIGEFADFFDDENDEGCTACIEARAARIPEQNYVVTPHDGGGWHVWNAALLRLLRKFGASDVTPTWRGGERTVTTDAAGVEHATVSMSWLDIGEELTTLMSCMYEAQVVVPFDWMSWRPQSRFAHGIDADAVVSVGEAVRLITTISRSDRFSEGEFGGAFSDGTLPRLLDIVRRWHTEVARRRRQDD